MNSAAEREAQVCALFPLVKKIARRVQRMVPAGDPDDLVGDGCIGLLRAVDSYDAGRGPSLEQYASHVIAGAMLNGLRKLDPVSERVRREIREAERERYALANASGELPSQHEMEVRRPALRRAVLHAHRYTPVSLDGPLPAGETVADDWSTDPARIATERAGNDVLQAAIRCIPLRQRFVLTLHYFRGKTIHEIGRTMAISAQRASQLHVAGLKNLRKAFDAAP